jgi:hypothetical protein
MRFSTSSLLPASASFESGVEAVSERSLRSLGTVLGVNSPSGVKLMVLLSSGRFRRSPASTSSSRRLRVGALVSFDVPACKRVRKSTVKFRPPHVGHQNDNPNCLCARRGEMRVSSGPQGRCTSGLRLCPTLSAVAVGLLRRRCL